MRRPRVRTLIVVPWVLLTLATIFLFISRADVITDQLIAISVLAVAVSGASAWVVAATISNAIRDLRIEVARLAHLRSSPVDPQTLEEFHALRIAITAATDQLHARADDAGLSARRFRAVLESLTEGVVQLTAEARFIHANGAAKFLLRLPDNVEGQSVSALIRHRELRALLQDAAQASATPPTEITVEERHLLISPRRLQFPGGGDIPGAIVGIVDLTQLRRLEAVRRDFVANVSHELKTPLTSIRGYAETLLNDPVSPELHQQFLTVIQANADRLQKIIDDLLDISRLQSGGWQPVLATVDVPTLVEEVWSAFDADRRSRVKFEIIARGAAPAVADAAGLRHVLSNVMENALRHTPEGGHIRVNIAAAPALPDERHAVAIAVHDTGTGIPRDALPRIFERFFRVDSARARGNGGTGLGLSIVKHLVEQMAGTVRAQSEFGKGTTIIVTLPAATE